jgi:hypothetical protein
LWSEKGSAEREPLTGESRSAQSHLSTQGLPTIEPHEEDMYYELGAGVNLYELSERIGLRRAEELVKTGAEMILSNCPACDLQLARMIKKLDPNIKVLDLIRFLDEALS